MPILTLNDILHLSNNTDSVTPMVKYFFEHGDIAPIVHAHWMITCDTLKKCSNCGNDFAPTKRMKYCPYCGAKME